MAIAATAFERAGFAFRRQDIDFGIDAVVEMIDEESATGRLVAVQVKSGPAYFGEGDSISITFRTDARHRDYWVSHALPVIVVLVDVESEECFWEILTAETLRSTGKGYRVNVPRANRISTTQARLGDVATKIVALDRYDTRGPEDFSYGLAKRYSFEILLNDSMSRYEMAAVMRQVTTEGAKRTYNRSDLTARRWGSADASVVTTYLYPRLADLNQSNPFARSQWIASDLEERARPSPWTGEDHGDGLTIVWNPIYASLASVHKHRAATKEEYLPVADEIAAKLQTAFDILSTGIEEVRKGQVAETDFIARCKPVFVSVQEASDAYDSLGSPPLECSDLRDRLVYSRDWLHNVVLFYTTDEYLARPVAQRTRLVVDNLESAATELDFMKFERRKLA